MTFDFYVTDYVIMCFNRGSMLATEFNELAGCHIYIYLFIYVCVWEKKTGDHV